ncbi:MAG: RidA family protein [Nitrospinota bacterium]
MSSGASAKRVLRPKGVWDPNRAGFKHPQPFSQGIVAPQGPMVWIAGQVALDTRGKVIGKGNARTQTRAALDNLKRVLSEAGAGLEDVVKLTVYLTDMAELPQVQEVRARYFPSDPPASSTIGVRELVNPDLLVEIEAFAILPDGGRAASEEGAGKGPTRQIRISQETYENLDALRREGETLEGAIRRIALGLRASGLMSADPARKRARSAVKKGAGRRGKRA